MTSDKDAMALALLDAEIASCGRLEPEDCENCARIREARAHLAARLAELEAELAAVRARSEVRRNDDGSLDEIVGVGHFQLEQMHDGCWSANLGPHLVTLTAKGKIKAAVETDDAARGEGG